MGDAFGVRLDLDSGRTRWQQRRALVLMAAVLLGLLGELLVGLTAPLPRAQAQTAPAAGEYVPLDPFRAGDSRSGLGLPGPVQAGVVSSLQVTGRGGVPDESQVSAVAVTVTALSPSADSWMTVWAQGTPQPSATTLLLNAGLDGANSAITKVGATGRISLTVASGSTDVLVDVQGYYTNNASTTGAATFVPLTPTRVYDSGTGLGTPSRTTPLGPGETATVAVAGQGGVPADTTTVAAVVLNVTARGAAADTWLTVWKAGPRPGTSTVQASPGVPAGALVQTALDPSTGRISVYNGAGSTHLIVDVQGYYLVPTAPGGSYFVPVTPVRILDSRSGLGTGGRTVPAAAGTTVSVPIRGARNSAGAVVVPNDAGISAVVLTAAAVGPTGDGWLRASPEGEAPRQTSFLNYTVPEQSNVAGTAIAKLGTTGRVALYTAGPTHLLVDVQGYFQDRPAPAPPQPNVSSATFPADGWAGEGASGSATLSVPGVPAPAVQQYRWSLDDPSMARAATVNTAPNAAGSLSLTPGEGWHALSVQAVNTAGNVSPIVTYRFGVGVAVTRPHDAATRVRFVRLDGRAPSGFSGVTWSYRRNGDTPWTDLPAGHVTRGGSPLTAWPVPLSAASPASAGTVAPQLVWDTRATLGGTQVAAAQLRACYTPASGGTSSCTSRTPTVTLDPLDVENEAAKTDLAAGSLDQLTGNLAVSADDVNVDAPGSDLTLSRTFNTIDPARTSDATTGAAGVFGPGWVTGLPVDAAGSAWTGLTNRGTSAVVGDVDGGGVVFAKPASGSTWLPVGADADTGLTLTPASGGTVGPPS